MDAFMKEHLEALSRVAGNRTAVFDRIKASMGWVVTTKVPEGFWEKCKVAAIPMEAVKMLDLFPTKATFEMESWSKQIAQPIMVVIIPDDGTVEGYSGGPILIADLNKDPAEIFHEAIKSVPRDSILGDCKRRAVMILYGLSDI